MTPPLSLPQVPLGFARDRLPDNGDEVALVTCPGFTTRSWAPTFNGATLYNRVGVVKGHV
jgi:hypothetical protein